MTTPTDSLKKPSISVKTLKHRIKQHVAKKPLKAQAHEASTFFTQAINGISRFSKLISSSLTAASINVPVIGPFFLIIGSIPSSIAVITDPQKSLSEKAASIGFISAIFGLAVAAVVLGAFAALALGGAIAVTLTTMDIWNSITNSNKYSAAKKLSDNKAAFNDLIHQRIVPPNNEFDLMLEIRAVELEHTLAHSMIKKDKEEQLRQELDFIKTVLQKKNITIGANPESPACTLQEMYNKRHNLLAELAETIRPLVTHSDIETEKPIDESVDLLRTEIFLLDRQISKITKPEENVEHNKQKARDSMYSSISATAFGVASIALTTFTVLMAVGVIAAAPYVLPIFIAISVVLAAITMCNWVLERITERRFAKLDSQISDNQEDAILQEALNTNDVSPKAKYDLSYTNIISELETNEPITKPLPEVANTPVLDETPTETPTDEHEDTLSKSLSP